MSGSGFAPDSTGELYLDTSDLDTIHTNAAGGFGPVGIQIPANAAHGSHWISAVSSTGATAQTSITVRAAWTMAGQNFLRSGANSSEGEISPANVQALVRRSSLSTGGGIQTEVATAGGIAYFGSDDGYVYAANGCEAGACALQWKGLTGGAVQSSPAIGQGAVFAGSSDGKLYAFGQNCGTGGAICVPLWTGSTGGRIESSPLVVGSTVFVGSDDGSLYAFSAKGCGAPTCGPQWQTATGGSVTSSPAVLNGVLYVGSSDGSLYAMSASTGAILWTGSTGGAIDGSPAVQGKALYVGSEDGTLYAFPTTCPSPATSCSAIWSAPTGAPITTSPAVAYNEVYIGSNDGILHGWSTLACGSPPCNPSWSIVLSTGALSSPAIANGVIYVGSTDGKIFALGARGLLLDWSADIGAAVTGRPTLVDGTLYSGAADGLLRVYSPTTESPPPPRPSPTALHPLSTPIRHVVVLYQENHSFDNVLGTLCIADARCDGASAGQVSNGSTVPLTTASDITPDAVHSMQATTAAIDGGKMDGFDLNPLCDVSTNYQCYTQIPAVPDPQPSCSRAAVRHLRSDIPAEYSRELGWSYRPRGC